MLQGDGIEQSAQAVVLAGKFPRRSEIVAGAGGLEAVDDWRGDTCRTVYTVRVAQRIAEEFEP
jgi:hypothetical protein